MTSHMTLSSASYFKFGLIARHLPHRVLYRIRLSELNSTSILTKGVNPIQFNCLQSSSNYNKKTYINKYKKEKVKENKLFNFLDKRNFILSLFFSTLRNQPIFLLKLKCLNFL